MPCPSYTHMHLIPSVDSLTSFTPILNLSLCSEDEAKLGARRLARCLQKIGFKVDLYPLYLTYIYSIFLFVSVGQWV